ncbi:magnesium/cobalt transporter CorA [Mesorhizobium sp. LHD-90]|uniref:magnesium/cobalt transporter CorA n=1 Tax=Mesorhizobium sp. LHD-90 TaxID=3071414 RepID=UPI0027E0DD13|nr:magnesium/cobalt transporter CorA [Mesorhizobium sp. LHD-90]MDQ6436734.1 magnesium/cobalt transporter CorA [Mesorhizobium sp. LHD-90]
MIRAFVMDNDRLRQIPDLFDTQQTVVWADLVNPTGEEEAAIEKWIGIDVPTRDEMEEIEISSRLYSENGAWFMTAILPAQTEGENHVMGPVTFVLAKGKLITVRYHEPRAFQTFPQRAESADLNCQNGHSLLVALLEAIVDRLADLLERASRDVLDISHRIFHPTERKASKRDLGFQIILRQIGRKELFISNVQDSLVSLQRVSTFLGNIPTPSKDDKELKMRVKTLSRDVQSLASHADSLSQKVIFLLDATLGMINIEQNAIIKIVSVAAVVFLPPTLVASIYGMNFDLMPELKWEYGYPIAIGVMVLAAVLPFWWFKRRGWL